jgi:ribonuclease R
MSPHPQPARHEIVELLERHRRPMHVYEIAGRLGASDPRAVRDALERLADDGVVARASGQRFRLAGAASEPRRHTVTGSLHAHPRGFAFVRGPTDKESVYVAVDAVGGALHGDRVAVEIVARGRRGLEGRVAEVLERGRVRVAGVLGGSRRSLWLTPDDARVRGPIEVEARAGPDGAEPGLAAVLELTRFPIHPLERPRGRIVALLGRPGEPDVEVAKILVEHGIDEEPPPAAIAEANAVAVRPSARELARREDLTALPLVTIDPRDARDHDDAVFVERTAGGWRAWIAIADVSHYVAEGGSLDAAARARGHSTYLPDRAVPMLPQALSADVCSLLPGAERLCVAVAVDLDARGAVRAARIFEGRMRSAAFLTYEAVAHALGLSDAGPADPRARALLEPLRTAWELARILRRRRLRRGALDFDLPEARVEIDPETRAPARISQRAVDAGVREAYRLVEELMLLCNETVARFVVARGAGAPFRVHAAPDPDKIADYARVCDMLGVTFEPEAATSPKRLSRFLGTVQAHERKDLLHMLLLRTMKQAAYDADNGGHFGLASDAYLHFTSPIRRYPDLCVHRAVKAALAAAARGGPGKSRQDDDARAALAETAKQASDRERRIMEAERAVGDLYRALYMREHIGEEYDARVVGVTPSGLYARIEEPFVDVLVEHGALGFEDYELDELGVCLVGLATGERILLGDPLRVRIEDASIERRAVLARRVLARGEGRRQRHGRTRATGAAPPTRRRRTRREARPRGKGRRRG